ncbi:MAG TPA: helicase-associated domain-containing protein, partial [Marmoricola sp.]
MGTSASRTLADQLRGWPDERVAALLAERPDLAAPAPGDSAQLAARASTRASVLRAIDRLDRTELVVLEAIASVGPVRPEALGALVAVSDPGPTIERLVGLLLIWDDGRGLRTVTTVVELIGIAAGPEPAQIPALLDELDPASRAMLDHLDATDSDGTLEAVPDRPTRESARTPVEHLLARGLLVVIDARRVRIPWSVRLALRCGRSTRTPADEIPDLALSDVDAGVVDRIAAGAAAEFSHRAEVLLEAWGAAPPAALRAGGLGVRDLRTATSLLQCDQSLTALVIEVAAAADLIAIGSTDEVATAWLPTDRFDSWLASSAADRATTLAEGWRRMPRRASTVGTRDSTGPVNALSEGADAGWLPALRAEVLTELATIPSGHALAAGTGTASLIDRLRWRRPRRAHAPEGELATVLSEAATLGVIARGALSSFGRALATDGDAAAALESALPAPVDHLLIQADLTAVAPGPLASTLARQVALLADVESRGGATVYRFTATSVRRAFDSGWSAAEVHDFLASVSRTPIPQSLTYLVDDVSRRFGVVRAGAAEAFLRSDDEVALTSLMHHAEAEALGLRRIAPTVVVSETPLGQLLPKLREIGMAPVIEAADGTVRVAAPLHHRARTPRAARGAERVRGVARVAAVVAAIRAG